MKVHLGRVPVFVAAASLALGLAACGQAGESGGAGGKGDLRIGLLLPENETARYEAFDRPLIEKKIKQLCGSCTVMYANAGNDVATQRQQVSAMITQGVDALILDAVDLQALRPSVTEAEDADVPVVAYDREVEGPISGYVSHDILAIGRLQGQALLKARGDKADGGQIVRVEGPPGPGAVLFKEGVLPVLKDKVRISKPYHATAWNAGSAYAAMSGAIAAVGADHIDGVWTANDVLAGGVISSLKTARITPLPPVVGQDAELAAVQRIIVGDQYMTVYKPYKPEAAAAATMALALARGEKLDHIATERINTPTTKSIPAVLLTPISLTVRNIKNTVVRDGVYTINQICTPKFQSACKKAGLIP
ncbi:substrate-binding domain-containing protein [Streptomyces sioyaensis]|uniref:substrate-binding domain-containing protein n=1 Tax=Streptomyces sioyaensis TaxID=67364 RepID=UPI0037A54A4A